jgi:hypothetical protein
LHRYFQHNVPHTLLHCPVNAVVAESFR